MKWATYVGVCVDVVNIVNPAVSIVYPAVDWPPLLYIHRL